MNARAMAACALLTVATGCGDVVRDVGDLGKLTYRLHIDYEIDGTLRDNRLVTGHVQIIDVGLTDKGRKKAKYPGMITHRISPASQADLVFDPGTEDDTEPPAIWVTGWTAGDYTIESYLNDEVFDSITIEFDEPVDLEVQTWSKPPGATRFEDVSAAKNQTVTEGTQIAFLSIPLAKDGERLVGDYALEVDWSPEWAAVQTHNVLGVYEREGVFGSLAEESLVFVDPATVVVDLVDEANGMTAQRTFDVLDNGN